MPMTWTNAVVHVLFPIYLVIDWLVDPPGSRIGWRRALLWLAYPTLYIVYTFVRGALVGWYPYPFFDLNANSAATVALYTLGLYAFGLIVIAGVTLSGNWLWERRRSASPDRGDRGRRCLSRPLEAFLATVRPDAHDTVRALAAAVEAAGADVRPALHLRDAGLHAGCPLAPLGGRHQRQRQAVSLRFLFGQSLADPAGVLRPGSTTAAFIDYPDGATVDAALVTSYVQEAVARHERG